MSMLIHDVVSRAAANEPAAVALRLGTGQLSYGKLDAWITGFANALIALGVSRGARVAVYLPKRFETVAALFGASRAGCVFVPVNPLLKPPQVGHILRDCNAQVLVSSAVRIKDLHAELERCPELRHVVLDGGDESVAVSGSVRLWPWPRAEQVIGRYHRVIDADMAALLYTSGSTGRPKGVVIAHRNLMVGAQSVAQYLENSKEDRLLAALPLSFDYGLSQLTTAFTVGASVTLLDFLFAKDVLAAAARDRCTGLAGVPPLWAQLASQSWPQEVVKSLRYITNSGGTMPGATLAKLRLALPSTQVFLMYGLTEAFRSSYLPPPELDRRPDSIGKAIPNAELLVVRPDGTTCQPNEPGELVHRGSLVSLGYWNDPVKTAERFRPAPGQVQGLVLTEIAVWSGDTVRMDEEGFLYFIGRTDEMIKTSAYRVSPTEVEEVLYASGRVSDAVVLGVPHPELGQAIVAVLAAAPGFEPDTKSLLELCKEQLPAYMVPLHVEWRTDLPRNPNGKFDRSGLAADLRATFIPTR
ncbi:MAG TPA: acyl-CoA ligase (AMP-forming), exosortase A system-associated [Steroidobacteraceae bacterium]|nr:acyl-CoA ligase (AMP-forming), exosortase A system-associated [Steroidobacteraceae bacterium]